MTIPNAMAALAAYVLADPVIYIETANRVFGGELPKAQAGGMPRAAVVMALSGGGGPASDVPQQRLIVDVECYGATPAAATGLYYAVRERLRTLARATYESALLHSAVEVSGPMQLREPRTEWPFTWSSWRVIAGEESTA